MLWEEYLVESCGNIKNLSIYFKVKCFYEKLRRKKNEYFYCVLVRIFSSYYCFNLVYR